MPTRSRSGNPAKRAEAQKSVTSVSAFKKRKGGVMELPSGAVMRLKNPGGMAIFVEENLIPNSLMVVVQEALEGGKEPDMTQFVGPEGINQENMESMMQLVDACLIKCAVEPEVHPKPAKESLRKDDLLYVDEVDDNDKMFVFQWVTGGTADLEQFRQEFAAELATLQGSTPVARPAKRASRARKS